MFRNVVVVWGQKYGIYYNKCLVYSTKICFSPVVSLHFFSHSSEKVCGFADYSSEKVGRLAYYSSEKM